MSEPATAKKRQCTRTDSITAIQEDILTAKRASAKRATFAKDHEGDEGGDEENGKGNSAFCKRRQV